MIQIIVGIRAKLLYEEKLITKEITKYNEDTGIPYQTKKLVFECYYKGEKAYEAEIKNSLNQQYVARTWLWLEPLKMFYSFKHESFLFDTENSIIGLKFLETENISVINLPKLVEKIKEVKDLLGQNPEVFAVLV